MVDFSPGKHSGSTRFTPGASRQDKLRMLIGSIIIFKIITALYKMQFLTLLLHQMMLIEHKN